MTTSPAASATFSTRVRRWLRRAGLLAGGLATFYAVFLVLGFVPIHLGYQPPPADNRVRIFVRNSDIHTDIVLPTMHEDLEIDWRESFPPEHFAGDISQSPYVAIGWGNREFFIETPTWAEFKISTAARALLWPSQSVLHVEYLPPSAPDYLPHEVYITREAYQDLARFVQASLGERDRQGHGITASKKTYGISDRFYVASGRYHCFNTCNQWTGRGLSRAGIPVGIWTPLRPQVLLWLPKSSDKHDLPKVGR